ncbi:ERMES complex subunit mmm1 [Saitozyma podzolica]|uniref:Maintenance of mitochondrial morphology protein 1 n=1 Tax=Saitozyma podzolica TaxID=1890683 RepID=A0A427YTR2_9TREE|nr:ERMES complex subunit mmm1 [Saitozyma podzolica]
MSAVSAASPAATGSTWTFTQGLILGQASFLLLCLLFIRYVVFSPSEPVDADSWRRRREERAKKTVLSTTAVPAPVAAQILGRAGYEMATHPAESTDWLNVLFAQVIQGYRNDLLSAGGEDGARQRIERWLNPENGVMSWLDPIEVTALSLGTSYPLLSNARIRPADGQGHIRAEIDVDYLDSVSLSLSTAVLINFPRPRFAVLPVSLGVELVSLGGTLSVQLHDPAHDRQHIHACLLPDFHLNLKTTSLLGSRAKLQDIPKLEQLIVSRIRAGAVAAMGEAVKQGLSRMVEDLGSSFDGSHLTSSPEVEARSLNAALQEQQQLQQQQQQSRSPPLSPRAGRKIPMPAGFPISGGSTYASDSTTPIPMQTPNASGSSCCAIGSHGNLFILPGHTGLRPFIGLRRRHEQRRRRHRSRFRSDAAPSVGQSEASGFRFRGHFSSQPNTPGLGVGGAGVWEENGIWAC